MQKLEIGTFRNSWKLETNKLGLIISDYKCSCGFLHARSFVENKPIVRCRGCYKYTFKTLLEKVRRLRNKAIRHRPI